MRNDSKSGNEGDGEHWLHKNGPARPPPAVSVRGWLLTSETTDDDGELRADVMPLSGDEAFGLCDLLCLVDIGGDVGVGDGVECRPLSALVCSAALRSFGTGGGGGMSADQLGSEAACA